MEFDRSIEAWLSEDLGPCMEDITSIACIPADSMCSAYIVAKASGVIAGIAVGTRVFQLCGVEPSEVTWLVNDGAQVTPGDMICEIKTHTRQLMSAERLVLNIMQRMGGIATLTHRMAVAAKPAVLLDTRKTVPGLRVLDKLAVVAGGGRNHRMGLHDMVMIKDNHIAGAGSITKAVEAVHLWMAENFRKVKVEVETRTLEEVKEVLGLSDRVDRVMLDNMVAVKNGVVDTSLLEQALKLIGGRIETEASGNVTLETVSAIGKTGVTYISSGALTHSVTALDLSLKLH